MLTHRVSDPSADTSRANTAIRGNLEQVGRCLFTFAAMAVVAACSSTGTPARDDAEARDLEYRSWDAEVLPTLDLGPPDGDSGQADARPAEASCDDETGVIEMRALESGAAVAAGDTVRVGRPYTLNDTWAVEHPNWLYEPCFDEWTWSSYRADGVPDAAFGESYEAAGSLLTPENTYTSTTIVLFLELGETEVVLLRENELDRIPAQTRRLRVVVVE